jgi:hypothetical protein
MPASEADEVPGAGLAVAAESLYLVNLLLAPGLAFAVLVWLYLRRVNTAPPLAPCHQRQTQSASLWAGVLLSAANAVIIVLGGYTAPYTWVVAVLYFLCCHAALVMFGALGLAKALAGRPYRYPLIGRACPEFA